MPTALITGASRGLGLALAQALAARGWTILADARDGAALADAARTLSAHAHAVAIPGDVRDPAHRAALAGAARELGGLDAIVNNASTLGPSPRPDLLDLPVDALGEIFATNVAAPLAIIQALREQLRPGAKVLNMSSDAAVEPYAGWGGYGASKAALDQLSAILAAERPDWRVYSVDPGDMNTRMHQDAFPGEDISDRPPPEASVPGLLALLTEDHPSGRYAARGLVASRERS